MNQAQKLDRARAVLSLAETKSGLSRASHTSTSFGWGVPDPLARLFPSLGAGPLAISGSTGLMLALAGHASREGAWIAAVGMPWLGWGASTHYGINLSHVAHIPAVHGRGADVMTSLIDGFDIILVGEAGLSTHDEKALGRRARTRGVTILAHTWAGAPRIETRIDPGAGYANGIGHLQSIQLHVTHGSTHVSCVARDTGLDTSAKLVVV